MAEERARIAEQENRQDQELTKIAEDEKGKADQVVELYQFKDKLKNSILSSLSEKYKEDQLQQILEELKNKFEQNKLKLVFDLEICNLIHNHINNRFTPVELVLLDILDFVAQFVIQRLQRYDYQTDPIYNNFKESGLTDKILELLKKKVEQEEKENQELIFSNIIIQLTGIYLHIMKGKEISNEIQNICIQVLDKNIIILFNRIISQLQRNEEMIIKKGDNYNINEDLEQLSRAVSNVKLIEYNYGNDNIMKLFYQRIVPLLCINCPPELKCQFNLTIPSSPELQQLQASVYNAIRNIINSNYEIRQLIFIDHNIIQHLTQLIISFEQSNQINNNSQQQAIQQYPQHISAAINLLKYLLNIPNNDNQTSSNKDFIALLIQMNKFKDELKNTIILSLSDKDKEQQLKQILEELKKRFEQNQQQKEEDIKEQQQNKQNKLKLIFDLEIFNLIHKHINNFSTPVELVLLDILDFVAQFGIQEYNQQDPIYNNFETSGLNNKVEQLLKNKVIEVEKENLDQIFSYIEILLTEIYLHIFKGCNYKYEMQDIYIKVIDKNIKVIFNRIKSSLQRNEEKKINQDDNYNINNDIKQLSRVVQLVEQLPYINMNNINIKKLFRERIAPLIHINCPVELNCQLNFAIPSSPALQQLQSSVYNIIKNTAQQNSEFKQFIIIEHKIISHLIPLIISLKQTNQINNNKQQLATQQYPSNVSFVQSLNASYLWLNIHICNLCWCIQQAHSIMHEQNPNSSLSRENHLRLINLEFLIITL